MNVEKKQKKSIENEKQSQNAENVSQRLLVKRKPLFFVDAISQLNEAQINSVKEIGFESVLHYIIEYIPSRLAFSLLKSFDEEKCKIKLYNGKKFISRKRMWSLCMDFQEFAMGNWSKTEKNAFAGPLPFLMEEQQQGNEEKSVDVNESGVGSSSQNILPLHMVANVVKYIKQINDGRTNLLRVLNEASSQIENNDLFGLICDIARNAIGSQKSPVASVSDIFLHLSQSYNIDNDVVVDNWKVLFDSIRNAEKANETIEDLNEFPTFRLDDFFDKAVEQRNKDNLPTSPVGDPEEVRQTVEEDEQRKENMICDDHNESNSPISTAVLGSPRTASPSLQQQEVNASEHDNTLTSLIGSENRGNNNNEEAIKATNTIFDIINEQEDWEDAAACSIVEYMMQEGIETMDDTPPEWNVQKQGYKGKETMHEEKEKTPENAERRMTVYQINKIEIIDSVKPPKAKDPLEKYSLHVGILILRGRYCEAMLTSRSNKKCMDMVRVADDWMTSIKHRLPELQNKFKEWFSCRSKK
ncbi:hypothetical protein SASPL_146860 [Salvia splendens]|uniref:Uncharacterized protein n=1 Tax=Salvia splendens TaxID=180675 RepID=A0A8X8Z5L4_SALSN|nr:hypothetical protein SASPL_146860 [Salvia splendens]